jgi:hypothetical protein
MYKLSDYTYNIIVILVNCVFVSLLVCLVSNLEYEIPIYSAAIFYIFQIKIM